MGGAGDLYGSTVGAGDQVRSLTGRQTWPKGEICWEGDFFMIFAQLRDLSTVFGHSNDSLATLASLKINRPKPNTGLAHRSGIARFL